MSSSGSSFTSSSLGRPPTYGRTYVSPVDSTWTPTSGISTISAPTTEGSGTGTSVLDLGPPGFQATIILFQDTPDERVVYLGLGKWWVLSSAVFYGRVAIRTNCSNTSVLPSDTPSDIYPHTLHSRHRPYYDPSDMERYLTFQEPHRIRYTTDEGVCIHDQYVTIRYEFTTVESSIQFQGDLRRKDLVDFYDVDVVWTNVHGRTDGFGKVKGIGAIQRLKLWRDRYTTFHSLSVCANKTDGQYREYDIHSFDGELRGRDDRAKQLRLNASGRRHTSGDDQHSHRRFHCRIVCDLEPERMIPPSQDHCSSRLSTYDIWPSSLLSVKVRKKRAPLAGATAAPGRISKIRLPTCQLTVRPAYRRFIETWLYCHSSDREFNGIPFPPNHFELPSPQILPDILPIYRCQDGRATCSNRARTLGCGRSYALKGQIRVRCHISILDQLHHRDEPHARAAVRAQVG
ncbi:acetate kinase [Fusarium oxysporum]|nr:acetate kinase [Fusarium oxysporum]